MKKIKIAIIVLLIILLIIVVCYIAILKMNDNVKKEVNDQSVDEEKYIESVNNLEIEIDNNIFFTCEKIINDYFSYIYNEQDLHIDKNQVLYDILDEDYIKKDDFTIDKLKESDNNDIIQWMQEAVYKDEIYEKQCIKNRYCYVKGYIEKIQENGKYMYKDMYFIIREDMFSITFSIEPITKEEFDRYINGEEKKNEIFNIEKKSYNMLKEECPSKYMLCVKYLENYQNLIIRNYEEAYSLLNNEYKEKRFGSLDDYKQYIDNSEISALSQYSVNKYQDYTEYVCVDINGNYYVFKATRPMQYTLTLDTYTIMSDKYKKEYNNANVQKRVQMNIDKFIKMINSKDYKNIYNNLFTDGFKQNNFPTLEEFKKYIENNFFEYNNVTYLEFSNEGTICMYDVKITDKVNDNAGTILAHFVVQLNDNFEFKISFDKEISRLEPEV